MRKCSAKLKCSVVCRRYVIPKHMRNYLREQFTVYPDFKTSCIQNKNIVERADCFFFKEINVAETQDLSRSPHKLTWAYLMCLFSRLHHATLQNMECVYMLASIPVLSLIPVLILFWIRCLHGMWETWLFTSLWDDLVSRFLIICAHLCLDFSRCQSLDVYMCNI